MISLANRGTLRWRVVVITQGMPARPSQPEVNLDSQRKTLDWNESIQLNTL